VARGTTGIRIAAILTLLLAVCISSGAFANESCLKMVFGRYCLGGDVGPLSQAVWRIELSWAREMGLSLAYVATDLSAARAAQLDDGL
jgi:hypothetical protein